MKLHIEGADAPRLMDYINGKGTLRVTNDDGKIIDCHGIAVVETRFYHASGESLTAAYICEINLDPRRFYTRNEITEWQYPRQSSLWCAMQAAMRGMGWSGKLDGPNSITIDGFIEILWRHAQREDWKIKYIEYNQ